MGTRNRNCHAPNGRLLRGITTRLISSDRRTCFPPVAEPMLVIVWSVYIDWPVYGVISCLFMNLNAKIAAKHLTILRLPCSLRIKKHRVRNASPRIRSVKFPSSQWLMLNLQVRRCPAVLEAAVAAAEPGDVVRTIEARKFLAFRGVSCLLPAIFNFGGLLFLISQFPRRA